MRKCDIQQPPLGGDVKELMEWVEGVTGKLNELSSSSDKYDKVMMETAELFAKQSYCKKRQVGAVLAKDGRILVTGYNGTIKGTDNECESIYVECPNCTYRYDKGTVMRRPVGVGRYSLTCHCGTELTYDLSYLNSLKPITSDFTVHAEQNVITYAAKSGIATDGCTIYITTSPCKQCAKLIAQSGITRVVYLTEYKDTSGIDFLKMLNIKVSKYEDSVNDDNDDSGING